MVGDWKDLYMNRPALSPQGQALTRAQPCPFCRGSKLRISQFPIQVECHGCGADGPVVDKSAADPLRIAIERWNAAPR